jgi:hypothetical protein
MTGFLEALVERLILLEETLVTIHLKQCGCDMPGRKDYCIARPREQFLLLSEVDPVRPQFALLEQLLASPEGQENP